MKDIPWAPYTSCTCTTYVLRGQGSTRSSSLEAEAASLREDPGLALELWRSQKTPAPLIADGYISIESSGQELFPVGLPVDIYGFWSQLLYALRDLVETGYGEAEVGYGSLPLTVAFSGGTLLFTLDGARYAASPRSFTLGLLAGVEEFFSWYAENLGGSLAEEFSTILRIQAALG